MHQAASPDTTSTIHNVQPIITTKLPFWFLVDYIYIVLFSTLNQPDITAKVDWAQNSKLLFHSRADSLHLHMILHSWVTSFLWSVFEYPPKWFIYSTDMADVTRICCHFGAFCVHHTTMHHVTSRKATSWLPGDEEQGCDYLVMKSKVVITWRWRSRLWLPGEEEQGCDYLVMKIKVMITWWRGWGRKRTGAGSRKDPWGWWVQFLTVASGSRCSPAHSDCCPMPPWWWLFGWVPLTGEVCVSVASWYLSVSE